MGNYHVLILFCLMCLHLKLKGHWFQIVLHVLRGLWVKIRHLQWTFYRQKKFWMVHMVFILKVGPSLAWYWFLSKRSDSSSYWKYILDETDNNDMLTRKLTKYSFHKDGHIEKTIRKKHDQTLVTVECFDKHNGICINSIICRINLFYGFFLYASIQW